MPGLRCVNCGLSYNAASVARFLPLAAGVSCRRCGGRLESAGGEASALPRSPRSARVLPVRSVVAGPARLRSD